MVRSHSNLVDLGRDEREANLQRERARYEAEPSAAAASSFSSVRPRVEEQFVAQGRQAQAPVELAEPAEAVSPLDAARVPPVDHGSARPGQITRYIKNLDALVPIGAVQGLHVPV